MLTPWIHKRVGEIFEGKWKQKEKPDKKKKN